MTFDVHLHLPDASLQIRDVICPPTIAGLRSPVAGLQLPIVDSHSLFAGRHLPIADLQKLFVGLHLSLVNGHNGHWGPKTRFLADSR